MKEKFAISASLFVVALLFIGVGVIEFFALKILGLQYTSLWMGILFIVLYGVFDFIIAFFISYFHNLLVIFLCFYIFLKIKKCLKSIKILLDTCTYISAIKLITIDFFSTPSHCGFGMNYFAIILPYLNSR